MYRPSMRRLIFRVKSNKFGRIRSVVPVRLNMLHCFSQTLQTLQKKIMPDQKHHTPKSPDPRAESIERINEDSPTRLSAEAFSQTFNTPLHTRMFSVVDDIKMTTMRDIFAGAESGQIGQLIDVFIKMENTDARLQSMLSTRRQAATRASHVVTAADDDDPRAVKAAELVERNIKRLSWQKLLRSFMDGRLYGAAVFENIWKKNGTDLMIHEIEQIDHTRLEQYKLDARDPNFGQLAILSEPFGIRRQYISEFDPYKLIVCTNTIKRGQYDLHAVMRPIARWYVLKSFAVLAWTQYAEKFGFPIPTITVAKEDYQKNKELMKKLLESVGVNRYGIFFEGMEYDLHQAPDAKQVDVFSKYIDLCNMEMTINVLGQNLTTEVKGGSLAASRTHETILDQITADDIDWLDGIVQRQIADPIVRVNMPSLPIELYPKYTSVIEKNIDLQKLGAGLKTMAGLVEIPVNWIHEIAQIPKPTDLDDVIGGYKSGAGDSLLSALKDTN